MRGGLRPRAVAGYLETSFDGAVRRAAARGWCARWGQVGVVFAGVWGSAGVQNSGGLNRSL